MKIKLSKNVQLSKLAQIFNVPLSLLRASNPGLNDLIFINSNESVNIPGYKLIKCNVEEKETYSDIRHKLNVTEQMFNIYEQPDTKDNIIYLPKRIEDVIIQDINDYTYEKMIAQIDLLIEIYPFIEKDIIGYSILNKPIIQLTIGTGLYQTHFNASFHGNEWITSSVLMKCINEYARLLLNLPTDQSLLDIFKHTKVSFVPMVNPDGVNLVINGAKSANKYEESVLLMNQGEDFSNWKANIVGVDLNKQYPALWSLEQERKNKSPTFRDYPGVQPLSQPESIAMANLTRNKNFKRVHALHTQGEEIYWGFQQFEPGISEKIAEQYSRMTNYKSVRYVDNYAGYKDWFIQQFRRPGFTIELGKGTNPLPISQFPQLFDATFNIFLMNLALII